MHVMWERSLCNVCSILASERWGSTYRGHIRVRSLLIAVGGEHTVSRARGQTLAIELKPKGRIGWEWDIECMGLPGGFIPTLKSPVELRGSQLAMKG